MMRSGRKVFTYPKGTYTPIISDGQNLYVTGYSSITSSRRPARDPHGSHPRSSRRNRASLPHVRESDRCATPPGGGGGRCGAPGAYAGNRPS